MTDHLLQDMLRGSTARNPNVVPLQQPEPVPLDFGLPISQPDDNSYDYAALHATLPSLEEARLLVQSYFRRVAWIGSSVSAAEMDTLLRKVYVEREPSTVSSTDRLSFQEMGLVAAVLAAGTVVNMELPPLDSQAVKLVALAQYCLIAGRFMLFTSLTMLDTLVRCEKPSNSESSVLTSSSHSCVRFSLTLTYTIDGTTRGSFGE